MEIKLDFEKIILVLFFVLLLFIGPASLFDHKLKHNFPFGYSASDAFQHQVRAESIKDAGNFRYEDPYISLGIENAIGRYPPVIYHLAVIFSHASGIETYDTIYFIVFFFAIVGIFVMYLIVRDLNKNIALLSLPLSILIFSSPPIIGFLWGHWPSLLSQAFLIGFAWSLTKIDLDKSYVFIAIFFSAVILTHTSEVIFGLIFVALFFIFRFISRKIQKNDVKNILISFAIVLIISFYYLIIFQNTWAKAQPWSFAVEPIWQGNPGFYMIGFKALLIFIITGIIFSLFKLKDMPTPLIFGLAMLIAGYLNYIGFGVRSFQIRFFWPIYLSVFFGFGIYMLLKFVIKRWNVIYSIVLITIASILLTGILKVPLIPYYNKLTSQGIMDVFHWSALQWLSKNTEQNAKVYFFYGDIYSQDALLRNSKRLHQQVDPEELVKVIQAGKIQRNYISELPGDSGGGLAVRKGFFDFEKPLDNKPREFFFGQRDICTFDYLVFDKQSRVQALAQYNMLVASDLLKKDFVHNVFENQVVIILKNNKVGADCIEERNF